MNKQQYTIGQQLAEDVFGNPICVGDPVFSNEYYDGGNRVWVRIVLGYTNNTKKNFRVMTVGVTKYGIVLTSIAWEPVYKCFLATQPVKYHPWYINEVANQYIRFTPDERKEFLVGRLLKEGEKSLRNYGLLGVVR